MLTELKLPSPKSHNMDEPPEDISVNVAVAPAVVAVQFAVAGEAPHTVTVVQSVSVPQELVMYVHTL